MAHCQKTRNMILCAFFAALIAVGAFIRVPIPVVPFTLQFLFTTLAGLLLGGRLGSMSVLIYTAIGLLGVPVFAEGGGLAYVLKPSFGYILGFALGAYVTGVMANRIAIPSTRRLLGATFSGLAVVYACGLIYFYAMSNLYLGNPIGLWPLFFYGFVLAVPGDIALCLLSTILGKRLIPILHKNWM